MESSTKETKLVFINPQKRKVDSDPNQVKKVKLDSKFERLPSSIMYEKSYMHTDVISHIITIPGREFLITFSTNGVVKFWKKFIYDIEFVKQYRAHTSNFNGVSVSKDGRYLCTSSSDKTIKVFDIVNFDMINILHLEYIPGEICVINAINGETLVAVVENVTNRIHVYNLVAEKDEQVYTRGTKAISLIKYNPTYDCIVTVDEKGMLEYSTTDFKSYKNVDFKFKGDTDLFEFYKAGTVPTCLEFSRDGSMFVCMGKDKIIRVYSFKSGKVIRRIDETMVHAVEKQKDKDHIEYLEPKDFDRRMIVEKTYDATSNAPATRVVFDEDGRNLIYGGYSGIKIVNLDSGSVEKILGKVENSERFTQIALFQDRIELNQTQLAKLEKKRRKAMEHNDSDQVMTLMKSVEYDPCIFATSFLKKRFFIFSNRDPSENNNQMEGYEERDIVNEKPVKEEVKIIPLAKEKLAKRSIVHTDVGDLYFDLYRHLTPKTVENFTVHSQKDYYNNLAFHRVIKGFMAQTGDPNGDGTGGVSIWGRDFEDEFDETLVFDKPGILAMANISKPNTNGSQFFITTTECKWLNNKHTIFGELTSGFEILEKIEKTPVDKSDRPLNPIRIINIEIFTD